MSTSQNLIFRFCSIAGVTFAIQLLQLMLVLNWINGIGYLFIGQNYKLQFNDVFRIGKKFEGERRERESERVLGER